MKRFFFILMLCILLLLAVLGWYNYRHDTLGVLNTDFSVRRFGVAQHFVKMRYLCDNPQKYNAFSFGSSRVAKVPVCDLTDGDVRWYNLTYGNGLPREWRDDIRMLLEHGTEIKELFIALDDFSFRIDPEENARNGGSVMSYRPHDVELYLKELFRRPQPPPTAKFLAEKGIYFDIYTTGYTPYPWVDAAIERDPEVHKEDPAFRNIQVSDANRMEETLSELQDIVDLSQAHGIKLTIVINPLYYGTYLANDSASFQEFKRRLAQITDYYDFSGLNDVTMDEINYYESSHYRPQVGRAMVARIYGGADVGPQSFGAYVTAANVEQHLRTLAAADAAWRAAHPGRTEELRAACHFVPFLPAALLGTPAAEPLPVHLDQIGGSADFAHIAWEQGKPFSFTGWLAVDIQGDPLVAAVLERDTGERYVMRAETNQNPAVAKGFAFAPDTRLGISLTARENDLPAGTYTLRIMTRTDSGTLLRSPVLATVAVR